jgi:hypothetical protein
MESEKFQQFWKTNFEASPPNGHLLRKAYHDHWFRIHTLPQSKRYAETQTEYNEILHRHNTVITDLIGNNLTFVVLTTGFSMSDKLIFPSQELASVGESHAEFVLRVPISELQGENDPRYADIWLSNLIWSPQLLDPLLLLVAKDRAINIGIVSIENPALYFPYDGGGDVIMSSPSQRDVMRNRYSSWLSSHPSGL